MGGGCLAEKLERSSRILAGGGLVVVLADDDGQMILISNC